MLDIGKGITVAEVREIFQNEQDNLVNEERKILISHLGTFSQDLVSSISSNVEEIVKSSGDKRIVVKRLFSILIEGLQNVRLHGERDELDRQLGYLTVARGKQDYKLVMANIIAPKDREKVEKYLKDINHLSESELKEKYISVLTNEFLSEKGGAGLGFIITRMKSGNPLVYDFHSVGNDKVLFTFEVSIRR